MLEDCRKKAIRISTFISLGFALILAGSFFAITALSDKYPPVTQYGGAAWVFLLSLIIAMPTVTPLVKRRLRIKE